MCNWIEAFVIIFPSRSKWKGQHIGLESHCVYLRFATDMHRRRWLPCSMLLVPRPVQKNGFNKPQRESGRHVAHSGGDLRCCLRTFCEHIPLMTEWCDAGSSADVHSGYLPLLDALPWMTFSLREEMVTTGRGGFHTNHELPTDWCSCEDKGAVLPLMHFRIAVTAQTDMIREYTICMITQCHQLEQVFHLQNATCIMSFWTLYLSYLKSISSHPWFAWMTQPEDMVKSIKKISFR